MRSLSLRLLVIVGVSLLTTTWYPFSLLPLWIVLLSTHFFSIREGTIFLAGFSFLGLTLHAPLTFFFILWACFLISIFIKTLSPNGKIPPPQFFFFCVIVSISIQFMFYPQAYSAAFMTSLKHIIFIGILLVPAKILGEAYQRYFNALGRKYE